MSSRTLWDCQKITETDWQPHGGEAMRKIFTVGGKYTLDKLLETRE